MASPDGITFQVIDRTNFPLTEFNGESGLSKNQMATDHLKHAFIKESRKIQWNDMKIITFIM